MMQISPPPVLSRLNIGATLIAMTISLFLPPVGYGVFSYSSFQAETRGDVRVAAEVVEQSIIEEPRTWALDKARIQIALSRHMGLLGDPLAERLRLVDLSGNEVAAIGTTPGYPVLTESAPFFFDEQRLGTVEIQRPLRFLFVNMGLLSLVGVALAAMSYFALHVIPLRQMKSDTEILRRR